MSERDAVDALLNAVDSGAFDFYLDQLQARITRRRETLHLARMPLKIEKGQTYRVDRPGTPQHLGLVTTQSLSGSVWTCKVLTPASLSGQIRQFHASRLRVVV